MIIFSKKNRAQYKLVQFSKFIISSLLTVTVLVACSSKQKIFIDYSNPQTIYSGRIDSSQVKGVELYWSGSSIKFNFEGESIAALIEDEKGDNYFNVILDNKPPFILRPDTIKRYHQLAIGLAKGKHSIEIFKRNEWDRGKTHFYGFQIDGSAKVLSPAPSKKRKIEFYGDSITAGYAVEDTTGKDSPDSTYTNNYVSYAAITARHYDADYQCICKSGIGITVSWFPQIMPEIYDRLNPTDPSSKWNFSLYNPDVVVINLLQNDSWLVNMPDSEEYKFRFNTDAPDDEFIIDAYQQFITDIRKHYPKANIICSLGSMDAAKEGSIWIDYIKTAVANINDKKIYTHFMPYIEATAHPSIKDQEVMANSLIEFIDHHIEW